jgi:CubicO group peptidase (beta-lactamase class C family)
VPGPCLLTAPIGSALTQVRWVIERFRDAGTPGWLAPGGSELGEHFDEHYLTLVPPATLIETLGPVAGRLRGDLEILSETPQTVRAQAGGMRRQAAAEADPPHRLTRLRLYALGQRVTDPRAAAPPARTSGDVPAAAAQLAEESCAELGLPGLVLAGATIDGAWAATQGWADLDRAEALDPDHRFPAYSITKLITSIAVLRLVAAGQLGLDDRANEYLHTVRLADGAVTIRELLSHTGGVDSPRELFASRVPDLVSLTGPVLACSSPRGIFAYSHGGYAALGQLIADVTGSPYPDAVAHLVTGPAAMTSSSFPERWPETTAVTGYRLAAEGRFETVPAEVCTLPAAGGLWATAAGRVQFGRAWRSLLPGEVAREALRPHAAQDAAGTAQMGLGWLINQAKDVSGHAGGGPGAAASLIVRLSSGQIGLAMSNRLVPIEPVTARLIRPIT